PRALVFFEAARRLAAFLAAGATALGGRGATIARELTKQHEELLRGTLGDLAGRIGRVERLRGEVTVVIAGAPAEERQVDDAELDERIRTARAAGQSAAGIAAALARETGRARREIYRRAMTLARG